MKNHDPIQVQLSIYAGRTIKFILITAVLALLFWLMPLWSVYEVQTASSLWQATADAWHGNNPTGWLLMRFSLALAISLTTAFYLALGLWWKRSGERHHRGAQFEEVR